MPAAITVQKAHTSESLTVGSAYASTFPAPNVAKVLVTVPKPAVPSGSTSSMYVAAAASQTGAVPAEQAYFDVNGLVTTNAVRRGASTTDISDGEVYSAATTVSTAAPIKVTEDLFTQLGSVKTNAFSTAADTLITFDGSSLTKVTVTFPIPFKTGTVPIVFAQAAGVAAARVVPSISAVTAAGFDLQVANVSNAALATAANIQWIAYGQRAPAA